MLQATFSSNKISTFDEYIDNWFTGLQDLVTHRNTDIAFSPSWLTNLSAQYSVVSNSHHELQIMLAGRYVGEQYVDNTSRKASALEAYFVTDAGLTWKWYKGIARECHVGLTVRNLFNHAYESNGWIYRFSSPDYDPTAEDPYAGNETGDLYHLKGYFPQAGRYLMATLRIDF